MQWQLEIDSSVQSIQQINYLGNGSYFFVQDAKNQLYMISQYGRILWKKQLDDKILGQMHLIDFYKNNKYQLLFNTCNNLYLIDKNGSYVDDFPMKFINRASNGLELADFEKDKNYRIYLAFENKTFIALTKEGRKTEGWKFSKTAYKVTKQAISFSFNQKDYIAFFDSFNIYVLNRKGENRFTLRKSFTAGTNTVLNIEKKLEYFRIITTDASSRFCFIYPDGRSDIKGKFDECKLSTIANRVYVISESSKINIFDDKAALINSIEIDEPVNGNVLIQKDHNGQMNFTFAFHSQKQINIVDINGKMLYGMPIYGDYPFIYASLSNIPGKQLLCSSGKNLLFYSLP